MDCSESRKVLTASLSDAVSPVPSGFNLNSV